MSSPRTTARASVEIHVASSNSIVAFHHGLGGPVDIAAFDAEGRPAPFGVVIEVSDDAVEVHVHPGQVDRMVATLAPDDDEASPASEGMHVRR